MPGLDYPVDRGPSATNSVVVAAALQSRLTTYFVRTRSSSSTPALPGAGATPATSIRPAQPHGGAPRLERTSSRIQPPRPRCLTVVAFLRTTVSLNPTPDRRVIRLQTAPGEQFFDIAQRERVAQIPAHRTKNQLRRRLPPLEDYRSGCVLHDRLSLPANPAKLATHPSHP